MDDGNKGRPKITAGLDLGDRYSHLCLIDTLSGEVVEEGRLRTTPEALRRRFGSKVTAHCELGPTSKRRDRSEDCSTRLVREDGSHNAPSHRREWTH
jgi:hypothetical protein